MEITTICRGEAAYPVQLTRLTKPPATLYHRGKPLTEIMNMPRLAVVGSRAITPYGKEVTQVLVRQLAAQGVVIMSGLAYGVDAEAHQAALDGGGITMALLPTPVEAPAPSGNVRLARTILEQGGSLLSTYALGSSNHKHNFVERNEYVAALSDAVLIVEGGLDSGTKRTVDFAVGLNVPVLAVPGNITSRASSLPNQIIKDGAVAVYSAEDILNELGIGAQLTLSMLRGDTPEEQRLIDLIQSGIRDGHDLFEHSGQSIDTFNQSMTMLEIAGKVRPIGGNYWAIV